MSTLYDKSGASSGQGLERAHIYLKSNDGKRQGEIKVQFNPNSLKFASSSGVASLETASGKGGTDVKSTPSVTMSVDLVFDALNNNRARMDDKKLTQMSRKSGRGIRIFPDGHGDVSGDVNSFYQMMMDTDGKFVEFLWGRMHFEGVVTNVNLDITLFDRQARPMRANVGLQIKGTQ